MTDTCKISALGLCLLRSVFSFRAHYLIGLFVFLMFPFLRLFKYSRYFLPHAYLLDIFSHSLSCLFTQGAVSFAFRRFFNQWRSSSSIVDLTSSVSRVLSRKTIFVPALKCTIFSSSTFRVSGLSLKPSVYFGVDFI